MAVTISCPTLSKARLRGKIATMRGDVKNGRFETAVVFKGCNRPRNKKIQQAVRLLDKSGCIDRIVKCVDGVTVVSSRCADPVESRRFKNTVNQILDILRFTP